MGILCLIQKRIGSVQIGGVRVRSLWVWAIGFADIFSISVLLLRTYFSS